jgi:hypothetical protein
LTAKLTVSLVGNHWENYLCPEKGVGAMTGVAARLNIVEWVTG